MPGQNKTNSLRERVRKALGDLSSEAFRKRVERKANDLGLRTKEAIFILAREEGVGYQQEFNKLTPDEQDRISRALSPSYASARTKLPAKEINVKPLVRLTTSFGVTICDPYLGNAVHKQAVEMSQEAYPLLYIFENSIRNFIKLVMEKAFKADWWSSQMTKNGQLNLIYQNVNKRMTKEKKSYWRSGVRAHEIYYTDFKDLITIINCNPETFGKYFANRSGKQAWVINLLEDINPIRNVGSHHNPLTKQDLIRIEGHLVDWIRYLEFIKTEGLL